MNTRLWKNWFLFFIILLFPLLIFAKGVALGESISVDQLPPEAQTTLALIKQGGLFSYPKDGVVFNNYEEALPKQKRGYYHEFTIPTPKVRNRGARRMIVGGNLKSPQEYFYTSDHYVTFHRIKE